MTIPLILLHGALGSAAQLSELQANLPVERAVFVLNFPGHGGVATDSPFSMQLFGGAVLDLMETQKIAKADIFGYSMGGYVALWLAWKYPERGATGYNTRHQIGLVARNGERHEPHVRCGKNSPESPPFCATTLRFACTAGLEGIVPEHR